MNKIVLSIIVPVYNVEKYIRNCINSILSQTFKDFELILVDDGSLDGSGKICDEYALTDVRVVVIHKKNGGLSSARNAGLDIAKGRYITFVDSDDSIALDTYDYNLNILIENESIDILQFPTLYIDKDVEKIMSSTEESILIGKNQLLYSYLNGRLLGAVWDKIFRKELFEDIFFVEGMMGEDIYALLDMNSLVQSIYFSNKGRYFYYCRDGSITKTPMTFAKRRDGIIIYIKLIELIMKIDSLKQYKMNKIYELCLLYISAMSLSKTRTMPYFKSCRNITFSVFDIKNSNLLLKDKIFVLGMKLLGMKSFVYLFYFKNRYMNIRYFKTFFVRLKNRRTRFGVTTRNKLIKHLVSPPSVKSSLETIDYILEKCPSVSRYGDGELQIMLGGEIRFQSSNSQLATRLHEIIKSDEVNHIVCIPDIFSSLEQYVSDPNMGRCFWSSHLLFNRNNWYSCINLKKLYYDACISRFYMDREDKKISEKIIDKLKQIWRHRDIVIVEGYESRLGYGNDLFADSKSVRRIICPGTDAFDKYQNIYSAVQSIDKECLILIALGPTATVLAYDLAKDGYQAIDIGHIDVEYEWYLKNAKQKIAIENKSVYEVKEGYGEHLSVINDDSYSRQVIIKV